MPQFTFWQGMFAHFLLAPIQNLCGINYFVQLTMLSRQESQTQVFFRWLANNSRSFMFKNELFGRSLNKQLECGSRPDDRMSTETRSSKKVQTSGEEQGGGFLCHKWRFWTSAPYIYMYIPLACGGHHGYHSLILYLIPEMFDFKLKFIAWEMYWRGFCYSGKSLVDSWHHLTSIE